MHQLNIAIGEKNKFVVRSAMKTLMHLGGIAPHAGLFSSLNDTSLWILKLRDIFYGKI